MSTEWVVTDNLTISESGGVGYLYIDFPGIQINLESKFYKKDIIAMIEQLQLIADCDVLFEDEAEKNSARFR